VKRAKEITKELRLARAGKFGHANTLDIPMY
jgi:hypothetical protein